MTEIELWLLFREIYHIGYLIFPKILFAVGLVGFFYVITKLLIVKTEKTTWSIVTRLFLFLMGMLFVILISKRHVFVLPIELIGLVTFLFSFALSAKGVLTTQSNRIFADIVARTFFLFSGLFLLFIGLFEGTMWLIERFRLLLLSLV